MEFFLPNVNQETVSLIFSTIQEKTRRAGFEFNYRGGLKDFSDVEKCIRSIITSKSFGMSPTYYFDVTVKPEILLGSPVVVRGIEVSIGVCPPSSLEIYVFSKEEIHGVNIRNLVEKLNLTENLMIKILDELGLLSQLESKFPYRGIIWEISSSSLQVRKISFWKKKLENFVPNKLFPLKKEDFERENVEQHVFSNGDTLIVTPSKCLTFEFLRAHTPDLHFRLFAISAKEPDEETALSEFLFQFAEICLAAFTILSLSEKFRILRQKIAEVESNFESIVKQFSTKEKTSDIFAKVAKIEPSLWKLDEEHSTLAEEADYTTKIEKTRNLKTGIESVAKEIIEADYSYRGLIGELQSTLENDLVQLISEVSILNTRFGNLNRKFASLKTTLATRIQIGLERRNLLIQNALGLLQIIALMVLSFELLKYFYPYTADLEHVIAYILVLTLPSIFLYMIYRKVTSRYIR